MKYVKSITGAAISSAAAAVLLFGLGAPAAWSQTAASMSSGTSMNHSSESSTSRNEMSAESRMTLPANANTARFVSRKIKDARANGKDVAHARAQERLGREELRKGEKQAAAEHFQIALEDIGVNPRMAEREMRSHSSNSTTRNSSSDSSMPNSSMPSSSGGSSTLNSSGAGSR